jgi:hypothetical protein
VLVDRTGIASVETVKVPPVPGMQKPPCQVGKRFWDHLVAVPEKKVKKPAGLKMIPAWLRQDRLGMDPAVCRGDAGCQAVQALRQLTAMTSFQDLTWMVKERGPWPRMV